MTWLVRFFVWWADLLGAIAERLSERARRRNMRACPVCHTKAPLLCDVEKEEDSAARLWECERDGCFDPDGKMVGVRRRCTRCGHPEGPANDGMCHKTRTVRVPCCYDRETKKQACVYAEPNPGLAWNPSVPADFSTRP